ncbi:MAG: recombinase family protein, partial [Dehalococcoidia bacterium]
MKCCIYCRVSTSEQELENQLLVLTEWAEQRGFQVVKVYQEEESAWRAGHQRELARLITDARKRKFGVVL